MTPETGQSQEYYMGLPDSCPFVVGFGAPVTVLVKKARSKRPLSRADDAGGVPLDCEFRAEGGPLPPRTTTCSPFSCDKILGARAIRPGPRGPFAPFDSFT